MRRLTWHRVSTAVMRAFCPPTPEELGYGPRMQVRYRPGMERPDGREKLTPLRKPRVLRGGKF
jgi:hypothetical protein